jgi:hypothetical protein
LQFCDHGGDVQRREAHLGLYFFGGFVRLYRLLLQLHIKDY